MSLAELLVIFIVAMVVFGPEKLPELATRLGRLAAKGQHIKHKIHEMIEKEKLQFQLEENEKKAQAAENKKT